jgi:hypothetical protein
MSLACIAASVPAHRDAEVGGRERRGVVDAVADHRDTVTRGLQTLDLGDLALGKDPGDPRSMPTADAAASAAPRCRP